MKNNTPTTKAQFRWMIFKLAMRLLWNRIADPVRPLLGLYTSKGFKYYKRHLDKIRYDIAFYPIEKQARYADRATVKNATNEKYVATQFLFDVYANKVYANMTATGIGNIAYMHMHSTKHKSLTSYMLTRYQQYVQKLNHPSNKNL